MQQLKCKIFYAIVVTMTARTWTSTCRYTPTDSCKQLKQQLQALLEEDAKLEKIKDLPCIVPKQKAIDLYAETAGINKFFESAMKFNSFWKNSMFATPKSVLFSLAFTVSINAETCL